MGTFEDVFGKAKDVLSEAGKKTSEVFEVQKLKISAVDVKAKINKLFKELGELNYLSANDEIDRSVQVNEIVLKINEKNQELEDINAKISKLKNQRFCPSCGSTNHDESAYCSKCGQKLVYTFNADEETVAEEPEEVEETEKTEE